MTDTSNNEEWHFVVFSDDWGVNQSSCQHIFRHIAKSNDINWINTVGMRVPTLTVRDMRKAVQKVSRMLGRGKETKTQRPLAGVRVYQPPMIPATRNPLARTFNQKSVTRQLRKIAKRISPERIIVVTTVPNACDYLDAISPACTIYYCVDDFSEWPGLDKRAVLAMESNLIEKCDVCLATSTKLFERLSATGKPTYYLTHGVDLELFASQPTQQHEVLEDIPEPRVGFFGLFDERSDQRLIATLAANLPDVSFVIAGRVETSVGQLSTAENVYFVGMLDYFRLPEYVAGLKILFIPYHVNALSDSLSPLKLKEYLATGRPVISTPIAAALELTDTVHVARTLAEWVQLIRHLVRGEIGEQRTELFTQLAKDSWESKAKVLLDICGAHSGINNIGPANAEVRRHG